jgi:hypothetical protein
LNAVAVRLDGVQAMQFGNLSVEANPGTAILIQQGTPLSVTTQSNNIQFGNVRLMNNGNVSATTNHGISVLNTTSGVNINNLISQNLQTTGSNYELNVASGVTRMKIATATMNAASAGNELNVAGADLIIGNRQTGTRNFSFGPGGAGSHLTPGGTLPVLSACGTSPAISGTDIAGVITMGTGAPGACTLTFGTAYVSAPYCTVTWQGNLASMNYTVSNTAIALTQTGTSSNKVNYVCVGQSGG